MKLTKNAFSFLPYFKNHYKLFLTNLFYTLSLFIHNIIFWKYSSFSSNIMGTYYVAQGYDTASFFAVLTTIPASIIFVVKFETSFYEKYKIFCDSIASGGSLKDIKLSKDRMISTLKRELTFITQVQFILTLILSIIGVYVILPIFANDSHAIELFVFLSIGFFLSYLTYINIIILIYFDIQRESLIIALIFLLMNTIFTYFSIKLGEDYYGLGYVVSSFISYILSINILNREIKRIDYRLYSKA
ncbi:exopolysaccharide Pel transporter PelG [Tissierella sp. Yu-01]|nr:exopolysaccharide Pel transporter PelG [Tissierella sp. Yu-01]WFA10440.1 exopolysaccharide Pel transporter PelG [Tissierella sp. Yu-01]